MVKRRPAVAVSPRLPHRNNLVAVVHLSTTPPTRELAYVVELDIAAYIPAPFNAGKQWAKCDMIATVSFARLDLFRDARDASGKRKYLKPKLTAAQLEAVRRGVLCGLGITV